MDEQLSTINNKFLGLLHGEKREVSIYLINGIKLRGIIGEFDEQSIILLNEISQQLIRSSAIATIMPVPNKPRYD